MILKNRALKTYHPWSVSPYTVANSINASINLLKQHKLAISLFLNALQRHDAASINMALIRISKQEPVINHDSVYFKCLKSLFSNLKASGSVASPQTLMKLLKPMMLNHSLVSFLQQKNSDPEILQFKKNVVECLLYSLNDVSRNRKSLIDYSLSVFKTFNIDCPSILHLLDPKSQQLFSQIFDYELPKAMIGDTKSSDIVTMEDILTTIQQRFPEYSSTKTPMYEIYQNLPESEKHSFLNKYLDFNLRKQHQIEDYCQKLTVNLTSHQKKYLRPSKTENILISSWQIDFVSELNRIFKLSDNNKIPKSEHQQIMENYSYIFKSIPFSHLFMSVLTNLAQCMINEDHECIAVVKVTTRCSNVLKRLAKKYGFDIDEIFTIQDGVKCSMTLLDILCKTAKFDLDIYENWAKRNKYLADNLTSVPFSITKEWDGSNSISVVKIHPLVIETCHALLGESLHLLPFLPMMHPPKLWTSIVNGGYFNNSHSIVFSNSIKEHLEYYKNAHKTGQMDTILGSLNALGKVAWSINPHIYKIFAQAMDLDSTFANIPPKINNLVPPILKFIKRQDFADDRSYMDAKTKANLEYKEKRSKYFELQNRRTKYETLLKFSFALYKNGDMFYFPYGFDFRGRTYPMNTILHHYDEDLTRALLQFWEAKPLGSNGFNWLKYQLAGVYGKDKLSFEDRIAFIDDNLSEIIDSANFPIEGRRWWKNAEKPWSTLSLCCEIARCMSYVENGGKVENYLCRIPVHMDGSCNGLQHYAALGRDKEGGGAVNLLPSHKRQDVYTSVLDKVKRKLTQLQQSSIDKHHQMLNKVALNYINRKVVKQTVMTSVYGVTGYGAKAQVLDKIDHLIDAESPNEHTLEMWNFLVQYRKEISAHISELTISAIADMFSHAKEIQDWLYLQCYQWIKSIDHEMMQKSMENNKPSQKLMVASIQNMKPMSWTTLTGFPVIQTYKKIHTERVKTATLSINVAQNSTVTNIDAQRQLNGIAPNFIHSVDSTHMQMACHMAVDEKITFVAVHDSFWTHPNEVETLNQIIRDSFVALHSQKILQDMKEELMKATSNRYIMVYYAKNENQELDSKLKELRKNYRGDKRYTSKVENCAIMSELETQFLPYDARDSQIEEAISLIKEYRPQLYLKLPGPYCIKYNSDASLSDRLHFQDRKNYTPVIVPVNVQNIPNLGDLQIEGVYDNRFFFS